MATVFLQTGSSDTGRFLADYVMTFDAPKMSGAKKKAVKWLSDEWSVFKFGLPPLGRRGGEFHIRDNVDQGGLG